MFYVYYLICLIHSCVLLATDVAARGLDIPKVQHVIHYQVRTSDGIFRSPLLH